MKDEWKTKPLLVDPSGETSRIPVKSVAPTANAGYLRSVPISEEEFPPSSLLVVSDDEVWEPLPIGANRQVLKTQSSVPVWGDLSTVLAGVSVTNYSSGDGSMGGHLSGIDGKLGEILYTLSNIPGESTYITHAVFTSNGLMVRTGTKQYSVVAYTSSATANAVVQGDSTGKITSWISASGGMFHSNIPGTGLVAKTGTSSYQTVPYSTTPAMNTIPKTGNSTKLDSWISDATTSTKGILKLAGCLSGTANSPRVTGIHNDSTGTLTIGVINDGAWLRRSGNQIVGT